MLARKRPPLRVVVVAEQPEVIDGLVAYLARSGLVVRGARSLEELSSQRSDVAILFPDDFELSRVLACLSSLVRGNGKPLVLLLTRTPGLFANCPQRALCTMLLLPRPSFGWTILDLIRAFEASFQEPS